MHIVKFTVNPFGENTYILRSSTSNKAIVVDPGMMTAPEREAVDGYITQNGLEPQCILVTHMHVDHVASAAWLAGKYGLRIKASKADASLAASLPSQAARFGLKIEVNPIDDYDTIGDGDSLSLDGEAINVLASPGHSPGGLAYYLPQSGVVLVGDSLFLGSIGRTDLPGGSHGQLVESIKAKILSLPGDTVVLPGHGPQTCVTDEKAHNPYL
mgnify:FL=1